MCMWNIRRECVHTLVSSQARAGDGTEEGEGESDGDRGEGDGDAAWRREVELTAQCLITNPKSYGAWHHRCYSLDQVTTNTIT